MKANILLVDDETVNLDVVSRRFSREDYLVTHAASGDKALELMTVQQFDLVVLDVYMPDMDGIEVLKKIKADVATRETPVIMLSADSSTKLIRKCLLLGAADYLTKPLIMDLVRNRIEINLRNQCQVTSTTNELSILIVDDHRLNITLLDRLITKLGHRTIPATNGEEALQKLNDEKPDLVLLDIIMPDMSGIEVLTEIRKTYAATELPVIMITAEDDSATMLKAVTEGANDYVTKPYDAVFLRKRIEACLSIQQLAKSTELI
ncbi:MAG: PleD family two-component system response regulator [Acidiferrobacterales bacterium]